MGSKVEAQIGADGIGKLEFPTHDMQSLTPREAALFAAWLLNGQDIDVAAHQIGMSVVEARKAWKTSQGLMDAMAYVSRISSLQDKDWPDLLAEARRTLRSLLLAKDSKVRFWATKEMLDRIEGKAVARMDMTIRDERPTLSDGELQLAISLMRSMGIGFAEAQAHIRAHPDEAQKWIAENVGSLPKGRQIPLPPRGVVAPPPNTTDDYGMAVA